MAKVGEVMYLGEETQGQLTTLEYYNGKPIVGLGGGYNKLFVIEGNGEVTALHPVEQDGFSDDEGGLNKFEIEVQELDAIGKIKQIVSSRYHTLYLTEDGFIFSAGKGIYGVLGIGGSATSTKPLLLKILSDKRIVSIACGEGHSLALTDKGDLYAWGRGFEGQLGIRKSIECMSVPKFVDSFYGKKVVEIACGKCHSIAVDSEGVIYTWGENRTGQLGRGKFRLDPLPAKVEFINDEGLDKEVRIASASAGFGHTVAITTDGDIYTWGLNNYGQLGVGDKETRWYPIPVTKDIVGRYLLDIKKVRCTEYSTFILDSQGQLYSWGKGFIGHQSHTYEDIPRKIALNTEHRHFIDIYTSYRDAAFFAPLRVFSISPFCGPVSGGTKLMLIGTAFTDSESLKVRFKYANFILEKEAHYDVHSNSIEILTPNFKEEGEEFSLPVEVSLEVTMDGENYCPVEQTFLIYSNDLTPTNIHPKSASIAGGTELDIFINLDMFKPEWLWHLTVGFLPKPKGVGLNKSSFTQIGTPVSKNYLSVDESHFSTASAKVVDLNSTEFEWRLTTAKYIDNKIVCKVPQLFEYDEQTMAYMVDVAINGQQFTNKPLNFRYYDVEVYGATPNNGFSHESTTLKISGKGFYDSSGKKIRMKTEYGEREIPVHWDRKSKHFLCVVPPVNWLFGGEEVEKWVVNKVLAGSIQMELSLNGIEYYDLPSFKYIDTNIVRIYKARFPDNLTEEEKKHLFERPEEWAHEEMLLLGGGTKRGNEEDQAMNLPLKPGGWLYVYTTEVMDTGMIMAQFMLENNIIQTPVIYKNQHKLGVVVPNLGDITQPAEVTLEITLNQQTYTRDSKKFKYVGTSVPDEPIKKRGK